MIPHWLSESVNVNVMGYPMNQNRLAVPAWSYAMEVYPPQRIVELGSYNGGFTICLGFHARKIGCLIHSFDVMKAPTEGWEREAEFVNAGFYQMDVFANRDRIGHLIRDLGRTFLLCDNGKKIEEFNTFAKYLKPGDVIGAHDFMTPCWQAGNEITISDVVQTVSQCGLTRWMPEVFDMAGWLVYRKGL